MTINAHEIDKAQAGMLFGIGLDVTESLKDKLDKSHGVDTAAGKSGIRFEIHGDEIIIILPEQMKYVEYGTPPHMPPVDELKGWARRKWGDEKLAWALAMHIKKYGTRPFPFIRNTFSQDLPEILVKNIVQHLG